MMDIEPRPDNGPGCTCLDAGDDLACPIHGPCTCQLDTSTIDLTSGEPVIENVDVNCPIHGINAPDPTVEWPEGTTGDVEPTDINERISDSTWQPDVIISEEREWEPVREFKFRITEPLNRDALVLVFIKYEYLRSWNKTGDGYTTKDGRSFVFLCDYQIDDDGYTLAMPDSGHWHEYRGFETIDDKKLPFMDGMKMFAQNRLVEREGEQWRALVEKMNEREDFYRQHVIDTYGPVIKVNAPTAEQIQDIIDNPPNGTDDVEV